MKDNLRFTFLATLFSVALIASNLFETKVFSAGPLTLTGGFLVFPVSYILNDCLTEVYGLKKARFAIWMAFAMNAFVVLMAQLVNVLPGASFWDGDEHFGYIFSADARITVASMLAFICGSRLNALVMAKMKQRQGEKGFGVRAIASSLVGESIDSLIFFPIAFWGLGLNHLLVMMATQILLKTLYEVVVLPLTTLVVRTLKRLESPAQPQA